jgi:plasmid maintenance system killer protein
MEVSFQNKKLEKLLTTEKEILKTYGPDNGKRIQRKLIQLAAVANLEELSQLPATRLHPHAGNRKGLLSLDVKHPFRLMIKPDYESPPLKADGGLDWSAVRKVKIVEIIDPH